MRRTTTLRGPSLLLALCLGAGSAHAQRRDTLPTRVHPDSIPLDTARGASPFDRPSFGTTMRRLGGTMALTVMAPLATSGLLLLREPLRPTPGDTTDEGSPAGTVHTWASVGTGPGLGASRRADWSGTAAAGLEVLTAGFQVDGRWEHVWIPEHLELRVAHVGWLAHPRRGLMGGVIAGWREGRGPGVLSGVDFGFPLVIAGADGSWTKLEPSYVIGRNGTGYTMSYRLEMTPPRGARALWPSMVIEGRGLAENDGLFSVSARYGLRQALR